MKPNHKLVGDIQHVLHQTFYSANITELNSNEFKLPYPKIIFVESDYDPKDDENLFDILGYFSEKTSDSIYLSPKKIEASSNKKDVDVALFTNIIYIHETAHYFHFHSREKFNTGDFGKMKAIMAESFAQLLTHRVCQQLNNKALLDIFVSLTDKQPIEYRQYNIPYETLINKDDPKPVMKNFSVESIVKAFVKGPLQDNAPMLINAIQLEAENIFLANKEPFMKTSSEYGLFQFFEREDEKFIN